MGVILVSSYRLNRLGLVRAVRRLIAVILIRGFTVWWCRAKVSWRTLMCSLVSMNRRLMGRLIFWRLIFMTGVRIGRIRLVCLVLCLVSALTLFRRLSLCIMILLMFRTIRRIIRIRIRIIAVVLRRLMAPLLTWITSVRRRLLVPRLIAYLAKVSVRCRRSLRFVVNWWPFCVIW